MTYFLAGFDGYNMHNFGSSLLFNGEETVEPYQITYFGGYGPNGINRAIASKDSENSNILSGLAEDWDGYEIYSMMIHWATETTIVGVSEFLNYVHAKDPDGLLSYIFRGNDTLDGSNNADVLMGFDGKDRFFGYDGTDTLEGGAGNDIYEFRDQDSDIVIDTSGIDTITSWISRSLEAHGDVENLTLLYQPEYPDIDGTGNELDNRLIGTFQNNSLSGLDGADILRGGLGRDILTGGAGQDDFDFNRTDDSGKKAATRDVITDFRHRADDIDLSDIDANIWRSSNDAFTFLAKEGAAFTDKAGQLRWFQVDRAGTANDKTIIEGDTIGNGNADFQIELTGLINLTASDFIL